LFVQSSLLADPWQKDRCHRYPWQKDFVCTVIAKKNTLVKRVCLWQPENSFFCLYSHVDCCQALAKRVGFWQLMFFEEAIAMTKMAKAEMMTFWSLKKWWQNSEREADVFFWGACLDKRQREIEVKERTAVEVFFLMGSLDKRQMEIVDA